MSTRVLHSRAVAPFTTAPTSMSHGKRLTPELAPGEPGSADLFVNMLSPYKAAITPLPFLLFVTESLIATTCFYMYRDSDRMLKFMLGQLLAINSTMAGLLHFFPPMYDFYTSMIFLPMKDFWLYSTGLALIGGGVGVTFAKTQVYAAWCLVVILILMFPGNLACVFMEHPRKVVFGGSMTAALLRLPLQIPFIIWAYWFTSPPLLTSM